MFVQPGFKPPLGLDGDGFRLEPLGPEHNERDHAAWSSSLDHIRRLSGYESDATWPRPMSLDENRSDLERHARDFADLAGFTYTVLDPEEDVVGCVYVYPADDDVHDASRPGCASLAPSSTSRYDVTSQNGSRAARGRSSDRSTSRC